MRSAVGMSVLENGDGELIVMVKVPSRWGNIRPIAQHIEFCVTARAYEERGRRAGVVAHELLENAVKYGDLQRDIVVEVRMARSGSRFAIRVTNRASGAKIQTLKDELERLSKFVPEQAFLEGLKRAGTLPSGASMLGLSRIAHEGEVALSMEVEGGDVSVVARG